MYKENTLLCIVMNDWGIRDNKRCDLVSSLVRRRRNKRKKKFCSTAACPALTTKQLNRSRRLPDRNTLRTIDESTTYTKSKQQTHRPSHRTATGVYASLDLRLPGISARIPYLSKSFIWNENAKSNKIATVFCRSSPTYIAGPNSTFALVNLSLRPQTIYRRIKETIMKRRSSATKAHRPLTESDRE